MKCFTHKESEAIGICMNCGKGVCQSCVVISDSGRLACSKACADGLANILAIGRESIEKTARSNFVSAVFLWVIGAILLLFGIYELMGTGNWKAASYFVIAGPLLLIMGTYYFSVSRKKRSYVE